MKGAGGTGLFIFHKINDNEYIIRDRSISLHDLMKKFNQINESLIYRRFEQEGTIGKIYPGSLNTLRILTMIDPETESSFIAVAVLRFGTSKSNDVDNWSQGGINTKVDIETGIMGKAAQYPYSGKMIWFKKHPDTGEQINGVKVPNWNEVKNMILDYANQFSFIPYIGWDVVVSGNQVLILEANTNSGIKFLQLHKPLLKDIRIQKFYNYHKII
jgi:hypothetical protein